MSSYSTVPVNIPTHMGLPVDLSTTPGGTLYSTTPGGTKIIYARDFLLRCKDSPYSKSSPPDLKLPAEINLGKCGNLVERTDHHVLELSNGVKGL